MLGIPILFLVFSSARSRDYGLDITALSLGLAFDGGLAVVGIGLPLALAALFGELSVKPVLLHRRGRWATAMSRFECLVKRPSGG